MGSPSSTCEDRSVIFLQIIIDTTFPMGETLSELCVEAIENVLAWAQFTQDKRFGISVSSVNSSVHNVLNLSSLEGNFTRVSTSLRAISRSLKTIMRMSLHDFKDFLTLTMRGAVKNYNELRANCNSTARDSAEMLVTTLITFRDGQHMSAFLEGLPSDLVDQVDRFVVVQLSPDALRPSFQPRAAPRTRRQAALLAVVPSSPATLEATLGVVLRTAWFTPRCEDLQPVRLDLSASLVLWCVAAECVLDPACLPVADRFSLLTRHAARTAPGTAPRPHTAPSPGGGPAAAARRGRGDDDSGGGRTLRVVSRLAAAGVCEGSLFGMPLKLMWAPLEVMERHSQAYHRNAHMFLALCSSLEERDEYLVVQLRGDRQPEDLGGYFIVVPGDGCLLLRAVAAAELLLPVPPSPALQYDATEAARAEREVGGVLDRLPVADDYEAKRFPSNLCHALKLTAHFPERLSLSRRVEVTAPVTSTLSSPHPVYGEELAAEESPRGSPPTVVEVVSSDEDVDLPEINVNTVLRGPPGRGRRSAPVAREHKLGTGGHPALEDDFQPKPAKRKMPNAFFSRHH